MTSLGKHVQSTALAIYLETQTLVVALPSILPLVP